MSGNFSQALKLKDIRDGQRVDLAADAAECVQIARRLGLERIDRLDAHAVMTREGTIVRATGRVNALVGQRCSVTDVPIDTPIDAPFDIRFTADQPATIAEAEIELAADDCDTVFYDGQAIDLGEAIADTLVLELDPYPRSAGAEAALKDAGVLSEQQAGPFAALAALKKQDKGD